MHRIVVEHEVVEIVATQRQPGEAYACVDQHAGRDHRFDQRIGQQSACCGQAEHDRVEDDRRGGDDAGLEAAAGAELAVELHVQREYQDEGHEQFRDDAQDQIALHRSFPSLRRRRRSKAITPAPAVNTTVVSPNVSNPR